MDGDATVPSGPGRAPQEQTSRLAGGSAVDRFYFHDAGEISGQLDGGGSVNALAYWYRDDGVGVTVDLVNGSATDIGRDAAHLGGRLRAAAASQRPRGPARCAARQSPRSRNRY